jgi:hypothetical protein
LIPGFSRPTAEKEGRAGGGSTLVRSYVGGPKTSQAPCFKPHRPPRPEPARSKPGPTGSRRKSMKTCRSHRRLDHGQGCRSG